MVKCSWARSGCLTSSPCLTVSHRRTVPLPRQVELPGFDADAATVYCSNLGEAHVLQATASALRLVAMEGMALLHEWRAPDGHQISMACVDAEHVLLATTGKQLFLFQLHEVTTVTPTLPLNPNGTVTLTPTPTPTLTLTLTRARAARGRGCSRWPPPP